MYIKLKRYLNEHKSFVLKVNNLYTFLIDLDTDNKFPLKILKK